MESRARKRLRKNDSSIGDLPLDRAGLTNAASNNVNCSNAIPAVVSEVFLENLRDARLLKICRLVCKSWNIIATKSLRACSVVTIKEDSSNRTQKFTDLLVSRNFGPLEQLPSPFRRFRVVARSFTSLKFTKFVLLPNIEVTNLSLDYASDNLDQSKLGQVFASQKTNIANLTIYFGNDHFDVADALSTNERIQLLSLKCLKIIDDCNPCTHVPFMKYILGMCNPERLILKIIDDKILIGSLSKEYLEQLKHFELDVTESSPNVWKTLAQIRFFRLRSVKFRAKFAPKPDDREQWLLFCKNVSPWVEDFDTNIGLGTEPELVFPNLKKIFVNEPTDLSGFTPDRFAALSEVFCELSISMLGTPENEAIPHEGVQSVRIKIKETDEDYEIQDFDDRLLFSLIYLSRQFPKVSSLSLTVDQFFEFTLAAVLDAFPKLTSIRLDGSCDFYDFSGIRESIVARYLEIGRPVEKIPRRKSITDLLELRAITFGSRFVVDPNMIIHCLKRIPKLKHVSLHWNESLSAPLLRDSLGHLEKIMILNSSDSKFQAEMAQVSKMLGNTFMK